jgi:hypothetical protein
MEEVGKRASFAVKFLQQLPGQPASEWTRRGSHDEHPPRAAFDEEQPVQRLQCDRFCREDIRTPAVCPWNGSRPCANGSCFSWLAKGSTPSSSYTNAS